MQLAIKGMQLITSQLRALITSNAVEKYSKRHVRKKSANSSAIHGKEIHERLKNIQMTSMWRYA